MYTYMGSTQKLTTTSAVFTRGVDQITKPEELESALKMGKKLRIKHGIDATSSELHIGHATTLWKLRTLQEMGHKAVILLGDSTTEIGDPTGRSRARPVLSFGAIQKNIKSLEKEVKKILLINSSVFELRRNSEWFGKMKISDFLKLLSMVTHARLIERDMFQDRLKKHGEIFMHEMLYPVLQGYDSVMLESDMTIIGSDQLFNEHLGRFFQERFQQKPQIIISLSILPGLDGREKMSKSIGNYIGLSDSPRDKFGKAMRITDSLIIPYLTVYTDVSEEEIARCQKNIEEGKNPMGIKMFFAESLVGRYHGNAAAKKEREWFLETFSDKKEDPDSIPTARLPKKKWNIIDLVVSLGGADSKASARRLVLQGAVDVDGETIKEIKDIDIAGGEVIRMGKKKFIRVV